MIYAAVDGHVHLREPDPVLLDAAAESLSRSSPRTPDIGVLMMTEIAGMEVFDALKARADTNGSASGEAISFWHRSAKTGLPLLVIAGRQLVTSEGLELLALGMRRAVPDGQPLAALFDACRRQGALAVLPWGVGKWLGRRGAIVARALADCDPRHLALGDNGGRPAFWRVPVFDAARDRGVKILPGSDPLPLAGQSRRIGRFGFGMAVEIDQRAPAHAILSALRERDTRIDRFGRPRPLHRFVADQTALRLSRPMANAPA